VEPTGDILVLDFVPGTADRRLVRIALTGARSVLSSPRVGGGVALGDLDRVRVVGGTIYLVGRGGVLSVDPGTGRRSLVSGSGRGAGPAFALPTSLTSDATTSSIVVLDQTAGGAGALIRVDLATGDRSVLSSNTAPTGTPLFDGPYDVVRDACTNTFSVLHSASAAALGEVVTVDGATGVRNLFGAYTAAGPPSNYSLLVRPA
jgi:hypothetical protein